MKPGRGIFCPFRVNPRIFSGSPTPAISLPPCPPALLPSLFTLPTVSCLSTFNLSAYMRLVLLISPISFSFLTSPLPSIPLSAIRLGVTFLLCCSSSHPFWHVFFLSITSRVFHPFLPWNGEMSRYLRII